MNYSTGRETRYLNSFAPTELTPNELDSLSASHKATEIIDLLKGMARNQTPRESAVAMLFAQYPYQVLEATAYHLTIWNGRTGSLARNIVDEVYTRAALEHYRELLKEAA